MLVLQYLTSGGGKTVIEYKHYMGQNTDVLGCNLASPMTL